MRLIKFCLSGSNVRFLALAMGSTSKVYSKRIKKIKIEQLINISCLIEKMIKTANLINTPDYLQKQWQKQLNDRKEI